MRCVSCDQELTEDEVRYLDDICNQCETQRFSEFLEEMKAENAEEEK